MFRLSLGLLGIVLALSISSWSYEERSDVQQPPKLLVITVCPEGPPACQFRKIQDAIHAAPDPQGPFFNPTAEIRVAPGTYDESLLIVSKVVELKGAGADVTFLRPSKREPLLPTILIVLLGGALIEGFKVQGVIALVGGGAGAHIRRNVLMGGVFIHASVYSAPIEENVFLKDPQEGRCGGISALNVGRLEILYNAFEAGCNIQIEQARLNIPGGAPWRAPGERLLIEGNRGVDWIWIRDAAAIAIRNNAARHIRLQEAEAAVIEGNLIQSAIRRGEGIKGGIEAIDLYDGVIQRNVVEGNGSHGIYIGGTRASVAVLKNRVVRNERFGLVTEILEQIAICQGNEIRENQEGDYGVGLSPQPSPELKQKCEGK